MITLRGYDNPACTHDRFCDKRRDIVFANFQNFLFQFIHQKITELCVRHVVRLSIRIRTGNIRHKVRREVKSDVVRRNAGQSHRQIGAPVISINPGDDFFL